MTQAELHNVLVPELYRTIVDRVKTAEDPKPGDVMVIIESLIVASVIGLTNEDNDDEGFMNILSTSALSRIKECRAIQNSIVVGHA